MLGKKLIFQLEMLVWNMLFSTNELILYINIKNQFLVHQAIVHEGVSK